MQYIEEDKKDQLIIKKGYENNSDGSYWVTVHFKSNARENISLHSTNMSMQVFVRGGDIVNRTITIHEKPYTISITTHNHEDRAGFDESFIDIKYMDIYNLIKKEDSMILDNIRLTDEEERIIITELLNNNDINIDTDSLFKLFQMSLSKLKHLSKDDNGLANDNLYFKDYEADLDKTLKPIRLDKIRENLLKRYSKYKNR